MGTDHDATHQSPDMAARDEESGGGSRVIGARAGEPLFKRFAVPKEWRTKDSGTA